MMKDVFDWGSCLQICCGFGSGALSSGRSVDGRLLGKWILDFAVDVRVIDSPML